jgi:hypothetical protein
VRWRRHRRGQARDFHQRHVERARRHVQLAHQRIIAGRALAGLGRGIGVMPAAAGRVQYLTGIIQLYSQLKAETVSDAN